MAARHPALGGSPADAAAFRAFRLLSRVAEAWFLAGAGPSRPPPGVRIFQPFGPAEFLVEAEAGFGSMDLTQPDLHLLDRLGDLLRRLRPELVHLHDLAPFGVELFALLRRECPRARIVVTLDAGLAQRIGLVSGAPEEEEEKVPRFLAAALLRRFLREATVLLPNEGLRAACKGFGLDPARLVVSPPLPPEAEAGEPPPSRHFLVAAAFPGPGDAASLAAAAGLLASLPPPEGRRLRIEVHGGPDAMLEHAAGQPGSPLVLSSAGMAAAHLVLLPSRDPEPVVAMAAAHRRPTLRIGSGAALAESLMRLLEAPGELAALQAALAPPASEAGAAAALLSLYRGLPA
ncbi:glycosyltransferase [Roseococcus sp. SYP-B2431]|uniref:glycosyltransferase n=1 Tax=Roseococcus sp. SYP-B2431 TaxID=2496640 RepID=UPI00103A5D06|nr:glycosyltransferase [Roseococcus sp. SYP-B2431]